MQSQIDIIIPTMWRSENLCSSLQKYLAHDQVGRVIVIDNDCTNRPSSEIPHDPKLHLIDPGRNIYVNPAWNLGYAISDSPIICLANDDISIEATVISMVSGLDWKRLNIDIIGLLLGGESSTSSDHKIRKVVIDKSKALGSQIGSFGACMFMPRDNYHPIPDQLKVWYGDDFLVHKNDNIFVLSSPGISGVMSKTIRSFDSDSPIHKQIKDDIQASAFVLRGTENKSKDEGMVSTAHAGLKSLLSDSLKAMSKDEYYNQARPEILKLICVNSRRILDVGCGAGALGHEIKKQGKDIEVVGIEKNFKAALVAASRLDDVWNIDLEQVRADDIKGCFDTIICADVIEHLSDPEALLRVLKSKLALHGSLILSIPNIRHWSVLLPLIIHDRFTYQDWGLLDRTHLKFFTLTEITAILKKCGLEIEKIDINRKPLTSKARAILQCAMSLGADSESQTRMEAYQYLIVAKESSPAPLLKQGDAHQVFTEPGKAFEDRDTALLQKIKSIRVGSAYLNATTRAVVDSML